MQNDYTKKILKKIAGYRQWRNPCWHFIWMHYVPCQFVSVHRIKDQPHRKGVLKHCSKLQKSRLVERTCYICCKQRWCQRVYKFKMELLTNWWHINRLILLPSKMMPLTVQRNFQTYWTLLDYRLQSTIISRIGNRYVVKNQPTMFL